MQALISRLCQQQHDLAWTLACCALAAPRRVVATIIDEHEVSLRADGLIKDDRFARIIVLAGVVAEALPAPEQRRTFLRLVPRDMAMLPYEWCDTDRHDHHDWLDEQSRRGEGGVWSPGVVAWMALQFWRTPDLAAMEAAVASRELLRLASIEREANDHVARAEQLLRDVANPLFRAAYPPQPNFRIAG